MSKVFVLNRHTRLPREPLRIVVQGRDRERDRLPAEVVEQIERELRASRFARTSVHIDFD